MKKNLKNKIALIVAVLLVFVYGIIGIPSGFSGKALIESLNKRIHRGLDLQGGVHLILQVVVAEAVNSETDNTVARIQQDLKTAKLTFSQVYKPDPARPGRRFASKGPIPRIVGGALHAGHQVLERVRRDGRRQR